MGIWKERREARYGHVVRIEIEGFLREPCVTLTVVLTWLSVAQLVELFCSLITMLTMNNLGDSVSFAPSLLPQNRGLRGVRVERFRAGALAPSVVKSEDSTTAKAMSKKRILKA